MKDEASSLDVYHLVDEFQSLVGGKVEKIYEWDDQDAFIFKIYNKGKTHHLRLQLPGLIYITERRFQAPKIPPSYARFLRNKLTNARIDDVRQHSFDRLIEVDIDSYDHGSMTLLFEVFKPANIVLTDDEDIVIHPFRQQSFKDRTIRSNQSYEYPPDRPDTPTLSTDGLIDLLEGDDNVEKTIATTYGLGGTYATEVIVRSGVDASKPASALNDEEKQRVAATTKTLFEDRNPVIIDGEAYPINMESLDEPDHTAETFSDALDTLHDYDQVIKHSSTDKGQADKYKTIIDAQQKQIEDFEESIATNQAKANYIYENYQDFATLIYTLREKQDEGKEAFQDALDEIPGLISYDEATNHITLDIDDDE